MIVFINGPFGIGKTTVARLLAEKVPDVTLYDREKIGAVPERVLGPFMKVEGYALWHILFVEVARLLRKVYARTLVIPMAVWRRDYFDTIITRLRRVDEDLSCFRLATSKAVLMDRISSDKVDKGAYGWRTSHVEVCLKALRDPAFGTQMRTDDHTPVEVADRILKDLTTSTR